MEKDATLSNGQAIVSQHEDDLQKSQGKLDSKPLDDADKMDADLNLKNSMMSAEDLKESISNTGKAWDDLLQLCSSIEGKLQTNLDSLKGVNSALESLKVAALDLNGRVSEMELLLAELDDVKLQREKAQVRCPEWPT